MRLAVISHKICWKFSGVSENYQTDGGFPLQMKAISELFDETRIVVPCETAKPQNGLSPLDGRNLSIRALSIPKGIGFRRKMNMPLWGIRNGRIIWQEVKKADAVHAPIPGDVGTIGIIFALVLRKPLLVRYCGNWLAQKTTAERIWKWGMEKLAGGRNVMLATGGAENPPSGKNKNIKWIFSTSLSQKEIADSSPRSFPDDGKIKLIIACRQEKGKGTNIVIDSLPLILQKYPQATLDVIGDGLYLPELKEQACRLNLTDKVNFHGKVEPKRVVELMKKSHIFCYPTSSDGFPKVVLEALACGLPVVTTRVSVLPQLISESCGLLIDGNSPESLAKAVEKICESAERYNEISTMAVKRVESYSLESWRDFIGDNLRQSWNITSLSSTH